MFFQDREIKKIKNTLAIKDLEHDIFSFLFIFL